MVDKDDMLAKQKLRQSLNYNALKYFMNLMNNNYAYRCMIYFYSMETWAVHFYLVLALAVATESSSQSSSSPSAFTNGTLSMYSDK